MADKQKFECVHQDIGCIFPECGAQDDCFFYSRVVKKRSNTTTNTKTK